MGIYTRSSFTGNYQLRGDAAEADCVVGHEFADPTISPGVVNEALATYIAERELYDKALYLNRHIAGALKSLVPKADLAGVFEGGSTKATLKSDRGIGTWGELKQAKQFMAEDGLEHPILVAQAYHVDRAALQAEHLGLDPIVPDGLPRMFDPESKQIWTKNLAGWVIWSALAPIYLKIHDQI